MIRHRCDACGKNLAADGSDHFVVRIEAFAACGSLDISEADLQRDHEAEMRRLIEQAQRASVDHIEDGVYRALRFDLCPACHKRFLAAPLGGAAPPTA